MQILRGLLPRALLAFFVLAAPSATAISVQPIQSTPDCAVSPTVFDDWNGEFWIQVVFLKYIPNLHDLTPYTSLFVDALVDPRNGAHTYITPDGGINEGDHGDVFVVEEPTAIFDRLTVATTRDTTNHFRLHNTFLSSTAQIMVL